MILRQVNRLVVHERRRGGQRRHQAQQAVLCDKFQNGRIHVHIRPMAHHQHPHIEGIQHHAGHLLHGVIHIGLRVFRRCDVPLSIGGGFQLIAVIPHPMGTGLLKQVLHGLTLYIVISSI